ncbi:MAG: tetratricopeptide repeat protein, partial [Pseudomonadota bacterium]
KVSNPYQSTTQPSQEQAARPVVELQQKALVALNQNNSPRAISYLQRAIKIQPRNALSWHYLARSYWQNDDFSRCLSMLDRSDSYFPDESLNKANRKLRSQCQ